MDVVLIVIAALSLILAIGMGLMLFKLLHDERQRSDARVAVLAAATAGVEPAHRAPAGAVLIHDAEAPVVTRSELFAAEDEPSAWPRRAGVAAAVAATVAIAGYLLLPAPSAAPPARAAAAPLELVALSHRQEPNALTITGSVHNPRNGAAVSQVFATAILFGPDGNFLTSGRAAIDFTTLAPGDDSPFVVNVPVTGAVARYRVGFRAADGSVIAHVDRRGGDTAASNARPSGGTPWAH